MYILSPCFLFQGPPAAQESSDEEEEDAEEDFHYEMEEDTT